MLLVSRNICRIKGNTIDWRNLKKDLSMTWIILK
ncbi:Schizosaccharomyces pombe specific protein [Schizosaccharomyces pombe]|uniref:Uncharacterized protein C8E11.06 n=1 Tax=Schizosaccharomyces pombe (strain 972 / ATCC 24843) TaxID=284812 RepID=YFQ6_SCHPO|nr:uncharacterized protein SPAC8E11.06 [Schizosaccharomyces pombe]O42883.2 RecName: Full=Uncharacterized protein C8E11.06 [Schizosaccharomyces pombe 972h-]CAA17027.2 sequence orphan [Schizosaccharomyces pombe]|eukprot:NP_594163.1 uncharacterized protein SPAC8E11.06 [Schizosaccharomyces pombe]